MSRTPRFCTTFATAALALVLAGAAFGGPMEDLLRWGATRGLTQDIRGALAAGADPNIEMEGGVTPLMAIAATGNNEAIQLLLKAGARVNEDGNRGCTALTWAARNGWT